MHVCYTCDPANPERLVRYDDGDAPVIQIPERFEGPRDLANGGIAAGMLACPALRAAEARAVTRITARLHAGVPLARRLTAEVTREDAQAAITVTIRDGDATLVSGTVSTEAATVPDERRTDIDAMAQVRVPDAPPFYEQTGDHPIPACFSCGPEHRDGLQIIPRVVSDGLTAAAWRPDASLADPAGALGQIIVASALDCSSGICMPVEAQRALLAEDRFFLLGSLDVRFLRSAPPGRDYRVIAKALARDGRKFFGMSALFDDDGAPYAMAEAVWIVAPVTRTEAFGAG